MDFLKLSKEISYALRHAPWEYELELDEDGWVTIEQLLNSLKKCKKWEHITETDLYNMITFSEKKRHEILDNKIRALYGHSLPQRIKKEAIEPPEILFHGTSEQFLTFIEKQGLLPQGRQYVHLSVDINTAILVGKRHSDKPIILKIAAKQAWHDGIIFYQGNDKVWLADSVPSKYIFN